MKRMAFEGGVTASAYRRPDFDDWMVEIRVPGKPTYVVRCDEKDQMEAVVEKLKDGWRPE